MPYERKYTIKKILDTLKDGPKTTGEIAQALGCKRDTITKALYPVNKVTGKHIINPAVTFEWVHGGSKGTRKWFLKEVVNNAESKNS